MTISIHLPQPSARTDTPSAYHYYSGEIARITGFSSHEVARLELLDAHPTSISNHVFGPAWLRTEVDDFVSFLAANSDYRDLLFLLIGEVPPETRTAGDTDGEAA